MDSLKYCDLFRRINDSYPIQQIRLACVFLKNEAFIVDAYGDAFHIVNTSFRRLDILCNKDVKEFVYNYSYINNVFGYHVLALLQDGKVYGWGRNNFNQVSEIVMPDLYEPRRRQFKEKHYFFVRNDIYNYYEEIADEYLPCMNANTWFHFKFDPYYYFHTIACGQRHCMGVTKDNKIVVWGDNSYGQHGNGSLFTSTSSTVFEIIKPNPPLIRTTCANVLTFSAITCGLSVNLLKLREKNIIVPEKLHERYAERQTEPNNDSYQTAMNDGYDRYDYKIKKIVCGSFHSFVLFESGDLFGWGNNDCGQLGVIPGIKRLRPSLLLKDIKQVATSGVHTLALTNEKKLFAMGDNSYSQLGNDDNQLFSVPIVIDFKFDEIATINGLSMGKIIDKEGISSYYIWGLYGKKQNVTEVSDKTKMKSKKANEVILTEAGPSHKSSLNENIDNDSDKKEVKDKKSIKTEKIYKVIKPVKVECNSFTEIVARRFSITHYTLIEKSYNKMLIENQGSPDNSAIETVLVRESESIVEAISHDGHKLKKNDDLISDQNLLTLVDSDDEDIPEDVAQRLEKEIAYLKGKFMSVTDSRNIKIHIGDKIKSSLIDGLVVPNGPLNIGECIVTGKSS